MREAFGDRATPQQFEFANPIHRKEPDRQNQVPRSAISRSEKGCDERIQHDAIRWVETCLDSCAQMHTKVRLLELPRIMMGKQLEYIKAAQTALS